VKLNLDNRQAGTVASRHSPPPSGYPEVILLPEYGYDFANNPGDPRSPQRLVEEIVDKAATAAESRGIPVVLVIDLDLSPVQQPGPGFHHVGDQRLYTELTESVKKGVIPVLRLPRLQIFEDEERTRENLRWVSKMCAAGVHFSIDYLSGRRLDLPVIGYVWALPSHGVLAAWPNTFIHTRAGAITWTGIRISSGRVSS
jgi:hypothetical protein